MENVVIEVEEKLIVTLKKDGGMESMEIQGTMALEVASEDAAFIRLHVAGGANKGFQFKTHPNIDKALHSRENILGLKDPNRPFPTGSPLGVLKWRMQVGPCSPARATTTLAGRKGFGRERWCFSSSELWRNSMSIRCSQPR